MAQWTSSGCKGGVSQSLSIGSALSVEHSGVRMMVRVTIACEGHSSHYFIYLTHVKIQITFVVESITVHGLHISRLRLGRHRYLPKVTYSMSCRFSAVQFKLMNLTAP